MSVYSLTSQSTHN